MRTSDVKTKYPNEFVTKENEMNSILEGVVGLLLLTATAIAVVGVPLLIQTVEFDHKNHAQELRVCTWEPFSS